jgi:antitoxin ParD1/3/4
MMEAPVATMNASLPEPMKAWVERQAAGGVYGNASDYVRDLIRKDQKRKAAIEALQAAVTEGVGSGEPQAFTPSAFKLRMRTGAPLRHHCGLADARPRTNRV